MEIIEQELVSLEIHHCVDIESLKLIHDIIQLNKLSLKSISFHFKLYNENEDHPNHHHHDEDVKYDGDTESDDEYEQKMGGNNSSTQRDIDRLFRLIMPANANQNIVQRHRRRTSDYLKVNNDGGNNKTISKK